MSLPPDNSVQEDLKRWIKLRNVPESDLVFLALTNNGYNSIPDLLFIKDKNHFISTVKNFFFAVQKGDRWTPKLEAELHYLCDELLEMFFQFETFQIKREWIYNYMDNHITQTNTSYLSFQAETFLKLRTKFKKLFQDLEIIREQHLEKVKSVEVDNQALLDKMYKDNVDFYRNTCEQTRKNYFETLDLRNLKQTVLDLEKKRDETIMDNNMFRRQNWGEYVSRRSLQFRIAATPKQNKESLIKTEAKKEVQVDSVQADEKKTDRRKLALELADITKMQMYLEGQNKMLTSQLNREYGIRQVEFAGLVKKVDDLKHQKEELEKEKIQMQEKSKEQEEATKVIFEEHSYLKGIVKKYIEKGREAAILLKNWKTVY